jgi:hypothetical protein
MNERFLRGYSPRNGISMKYAMVSSYAAPSSIGIGVMEIAGEEEDDGVSEGSSAEQGDGVKCH